LHKCPYCDFNSHAAAVFPTDEYVAVLCQELALWRPRLGKKRLKSVFFGGGTPSLMGGPAVGKILAALDQAFGLQPETEITVECNPTSSSLAVFRDFKAAGVNRLSLGVQTFSAENLAFLGRRHSAAEALENLDQACAVIGNVNADMIFGLPRQNLDDWQGDLKRLAEAGTSHLSCYQLTIEPHTRFYGEVRKGLWQPLDDDAQADFIETTAETLNSLGFLGYETSNFARPGQECRHNRHVWRYGDYLGLGAGAHGRVTVDGVRLATRVRRDPRDYMRRVREQGSALVEEEIIPPAVAWREAVMLGLRLTEGICLDRLQQLIPMPGGGPGVDLRRLRTLRDRDLLWQQGNTWGTTPRGRLLLDALLRAVFEPAPVLAASQGSDNVSPL
jgi:oxygen-independent coproporphyrinogen-3 oxidase